MAIIKIETKNKVDIDKKPRVYFTCHKENIEKILSDCKLFVLRRSFSKGLLTKTV